MNSILFSQQTFDSPINKQLGLGLVEVLVSLLLLAVGGLGYAALQIQTLGATDEALIRTQALVLLHSTAEQIRINAVDHVIHQHVSHPQRPSDKSSLPSTADILAYYAKQFESSGSNSHNKTSAPDCHTQPCLPKQRAATDVLELTRRAEIIGVKLGMVACPDGGATAARFKYCLVAAWHTTTATRGNSRHDCFEGSSGGYAKDADCVFMEAY